MIAALKEASEGSGKSINRIADEHGVPRTTLKDRLSGRIIHGVKPGPCPFLSRTEETRLCDFLIESANMGYGKTRRQVLSLAENVAREKGLLQGARISTGWWKRFLERQPKLSLRRGDATAHVRMDALSQETIDQYFTLLREVYEEHNFEANPAQIYNMDETGMPLDPRPPKVVARKGQKKVRSRTSGNKSQITVLGCVNCTGQAIPPMVIFDTQKLNREWISVHQINSCSFDRSSGWFNP